ncbi:MAG: RluA family pseudouridine synthase [Candidatus Mcinerneyibacterium aminivorans]|uniref:Pseudouridine synthase n=1 Tax=Candidatus Mcinerneyibacterium aminivorans TaxID=2703815 RepID=A0A5D0MER2_9BACT|nr:MAG: RluA family pseudouridine synthase [Candidatus Mcinerneyibacterium aminivorans]
MNLNLQLFPLFYLKVILVEFKIDKRFDGARLDTFIRKKYKNKKLGFLYKSIRKGDVKVNDKSKNPSFKLQKGDIVTFDEEIENENKEEIELSEDEKKLITDSIVYENDRFLLVNKSSGLVVHKGTGHEYGLLEMLKSFYNNDDIHLINRLDKDTSGLIIASKNIIEARKLNKMFKNRNVNKKYYAVVKGASNENNFKITKRIKKTGSGVKISDEGKEAITQCRIINKNKKYSLLDIDLITGRKHQIRIHLADFGLPIIGDYKYGVSKGNKMYLLSYSIEIPEYDFKFELDIPEDFKLFFK